MPNMVDREEVVVKLSKLRDKLPDASQRDAFQPVIDKLLDEYDNTPNFSPVMNLISAQGPKLDLDGYRRCLFEPKEGDTDIYVRVLEKGGDGGNAIVPFMVM